MEIMEVHREGHFGEILKKTKAKLALHASAGAGAPTRKRKINSPQYGGQVEKRSKIQPVIIHSVCPPLIHAEPSNFMWIVQSLTGCAVTRLRCEESNRGCGGSPTSTMCGAASSSCTTSASTEEQHEGSHVRILNEASPVADSGPQVLAANNEEEIHIECNFLVSGNKGDDDHEASSSPVLMSSYEGEHETSSSALFITRHGEHEVSSSPAFLNNYEGEHETSSSACNSGEYGAGRCGLQLEGNFGLFNDSRACDDDHLFYLDNAPPQGLNSSVDSYLEHLLFSYDSIAPCKYSSTASMLADVCDPSLLKDLL